MRRYSEPARRYHTLDHVAAVVAVLDELIEHGLAEDPVAVRLAGWLHDVVYDPKAADNERRSASYAVSLVERLGPGAGPAVDVAKAVALIELTAGHDPVIATGIGPDGAVMVDADLAILGSSPAGYERYRNAVRAEYGWLDDEAWRAGRRAVLEGFLHRDRIYLTDLLFDRLETPARANLAHELATMYRSDLPG